MEKKTFKFFSTGSLSLYDEYGWGSKEVHIGKLRPCNTVELEVEDSDNYVYVDLTVEQIKALVEHLNKQVSEFEGKQK